MSISVQASQIINFGPYHLVSHINLLYIIIILAVKTLDMLNFKGLVSFKINIKLAI